MPIIQIDWQEIKERFGDVTALYALTHRQASLLLSLSEQLSWEKTFREFGYDFEDKDDLDWDIEDLRNNLVSPVDLVDIIGYIDDIEDGIQALIDIASAQEPCCQTQDITDGDQYTDPVIDGEGDVPSNIVDAGYASDSSDWAGFADYKCMISHQMVYTLETRLRLMADRFDPTGRVIGGIGAAAAIAAALIPTPAAPAAAIALGIIGSLGAVAAFYGAATALGKIALENLADDVDDNHNALACAIYSADGSEAAYQALKDEVNSIWSDVNATVILSMNLGPTIKALYAGRYDQINVAQELADRGYDTDDYDCTCIELEPNQLIPNPEFLESASGWDLDAISGGAHYTYYASNLGEDDVISYSASTSDTGQDLRSSNFFVPEGIETLYPEVRLYGLVSRSYTHYISIFRASDGAPAGSTYVVKNSGEASGWYTKFAAADPITCTSGVTYYATMRVTVIGGSETPKWSWAKLWTVDPEA